MAGARWVDDLVLRAAEVLPAPVARYVAAGSGEGTTVGEAGSRWDAARFAPRVLRPVTDVSTSSEVLGSTTPVLGLAPCTMMRAAHPGGETEAARGAAAAGALMVVSSNTGSSFDAIGATGVRWWLQAYLPPDRVSLEPVLRRAVGAGASGVVLTADTPVVARKHDPVAARVWDEVGAAGWVGAELRDVGVPGRAGGEGTDRHREKATDLGPHDVGWLHGVTGLPVVVKGVLRADDARRCVDAGAAGVWVSNHGGRQLDGAVATADALLPVAREVAPAPVLVDGGVRTARHVLAALGRGADLVMLARPVVAALALDGAAGVEELLSRLQHDLSEQMRLVGAVSPADVRGTVDAGRPFDPAWP